MRKTHLALLTAFASLALSLFAAEEGVKLTDDGKGTVRVDINGKLFTEYHYAGARRPYLYPIIGPTGAGMTRNWPLKEGVAGEETDHVHHKGLWYGHRSVNGYGFWEDVGKADAKLGQIKHDSFVHVRSGREAGELRSINKWVADDGKLVLTDDRTIRIQGRKEGPTLDFEITFTAPTTGDVVFGDDKDGAMATRITETMRLSKPKEKGKKTATPGDGHIVLSTGARDGETWGKRAEWCDYSGPVEGKTVGIAIFDHPNNPRHPTWWHVRDYGLFAANPFGQAQFEKLDDKKAGEFKIVAGQSVTFRYRFFWHEGDEQQAKVADRYKEYVWQTTSKPAAKKATPKKK
ncbi:MAG: PmoA family protein [Verrucomicrobia bacterium]|nr:PmoA family protein [Verrucomicrobiota bacterium]